MVVIKLFIAMADAGHGAPLRQNTSAAIAPIRVAPAAVDADTAQRF